jgi:hypothetical protein
MAVACPLLSLARSLSHSLPGSLQVSFSLALSLPHLVVHVPLQSVLQQLQGGGARPLHVHGVVSVVRDVVGAPAVPQRLPMEERRRRRV